MLAKALYYLYLYKLLLFVCLFLFVSVANGKILLLVPKVLHSRTHSSIHSLCASEKSNQIKYSYSRTTVNTDSRLPPQSLYEI